MQNLWLPIEMLTAMFVYAAGLEKREKALLRGAAGIFAYLLLMIIAADFAAETDAAWPEGNAVYVSTVFSCGIIFALMAAAVLSICKVRVREAVYCTTCAYLTEHMAYCIRLLVNHMPGNIPAPNGSIGHIAIHAAVYVICYRLVAKNMIRDRHYATSVLQSLGLMLGVSLLVIVMSVLATGFGFELLHGVYAFFACAFILYGQVIQQKQQKLQEELNIRQQMWLKSKAQYEMAKDAVDIINTKCHDLKYQVQALRASGSAQEQKKVIDSMEDAAAIYDSVFHTENEYLNTVLTEKSLLCKKNHITLTCIADGNVLDFMDAVDLYTLFGNALDNAMEAVMKLGEEERLIHLLICEKAGLVMIQTENYYQGEIRMEGRLPVTTKEEKAYHGFGVRSICDIVEKYHGVLTIETERQIFVLRAALPARQV